MFELKPMTPIGELPDEIKKKAERSVVLQNQNRQAISEISRVGGTLDIANARLDFVLSMLLGLEILSEEQFWTLSLAWESNLRSQLKEVRTVMTEQMRKQQVQKKLWRPGMPGGPNGATRPEG